jgi:hypothetical protein
MGSEGVLEAQMSIERSLSGFCPWARVIRRARSLHRESSCLSLPVGEETVHVEGALLLEHEIRGPAKPGRENAEGLAVAMSYAEPFDEGMGARIIVEEADGGLGEGPLEVGVADFGAASMRITRFTPRRADARLAAAGNRNG